MNLRNFDRCQHSLSDKILIDNKRVLYYFKYTYIFIYTFRGLL